jgi:hypothetical protein
MAGPLSCEAQSLGLSAVCSVKVPIGSALMGKLIGFCVSGERIGVCSAGVGW